MPRSGPIAIGVDQRHVKRGIIHVDVIRDDFHFVHVERIAEPILNIGIFPGVIPDVGTMRPRPSDEVRNLRGRERISPQRRASG